MSRLFILFVFIVIAAAHSQAQDPPPLVISEVYGGGGNAGALYTHDFVELYNPGPDSVSIVDWSIQYQAAGGTAPFGSAVKLTHVLPPFGFMLIQLNPGSGGTEPLPPPDAAGSFSLAAANGKIALVRDTLPVSSPADSTVVDFAGYGTANEYEGAGPAPAPGNATSIERKAHPASTQESMAPGGEDELSGNGHDGGDNAGDFLVRQVPGPQNSASPSETPSGDQDTTVSIGVGSRWNLLSVPVLADSPWVAALFPGALTQPAGYDGHSGGYFTMDTLLPGRGFWLKFSSEASISLTGAPVFSDTITLADGWNLIGTVLPAVDVLTIVEIPVGHLGSHFFLYREGYLPVDTLEPGRGYWIKSSGGGLIVLQGP